MQISEEDRKAFHSQADRVSKAVSAEELRRLAKEGRVKGSLFKRLYRLSRRSHGRSAPPLHR